MASDNMLFMKQPDGKMVELYASELIEFEAARLRIHRAPHNCRFAGCSNPDWYISDRVLSFHERKRLEVDHWKFPSSCPEHRAASKQLFIAKQNPDLCPKSKKRQFKSQQDAAEYASTLANQQYAYACDDCDGWHLSSLSPEQNAELQERKQQRQRERENLNFGQKPVETAASVVSSTATLTAATSPAPVVAPAEDAETQSCRMYKDGVRVTEIAVRLGISTASIYQYLRKNRIQTKAVGRGAYKSTFTSPPAISSTVDLDEAEARLLQQLQDVQRKKKLMDEAKRLRVEMVNSNAFRIMKEGEHATLPMADLEPLVNMLIALAPQPDAAEQAVAVGAEGGK